MKTTTPDDGDLPLFDRARMRAETLAARDEAIEAVDRAADPEWKAEALAAVREMALRRDEFTSDDVWDAGLAKTREDRALGPIFLAAARAGWISRTDRVRPSHRSSHGSGKVIWRSLLR